MDTGDSGVKVDKRFARKKWSSEKSHEIMMTPRRHDRVAVAKQMEPSPGYDEYLFLLQQRNKMLEKVKLTDKKQIEKEKKEKGFSLYVNGANDKKGNNARRRTPRHTPRHTPNSRLATELSHLSKNSPRQEELALNIPSLTSRSRSAPEKAEKKSRKNWNASSVNIQTARGEKMHLNAPDTITGDYSEDFEDVTESINNNNESEATVHDSINSDGDEETTISDHVLLSVHDISKLRKSLELSKFVRESICQNTDDDDSEVDEEIEEVTGSDLISAGDTIVLEFAPSKPSNLHTDSKISSKSSHSSHKTSRSKQETGRQIHLRPSKTPDKTPRPLSSVKRKSTDTKTESVEQRSQVLSALAKENQQLSEYRRSSEKGGNSGPLINSFMLSTDEDIKEVEGRVLQMEPRQQRQLIKTLYQLEKTVRPSSTAVTTRGSKHGRSKSKDTEVHKVVLELVSNWGHNKLIGLTEIMLLDECNRRLEVNTSFLRVDGAKNFVGAEANLFNNKYRTVKDRNMFCCQRSGQRPVSLSFRIEIPLGSQISKVRIWNYNKSLNDLNIGVRRLRISIDDDILYDGELEKGCGNQVFDYGHSIVIGSVKSDSDAEKDNVGSSISAAKLTSAADQKSAAVTSPLHRLHHPDHNSVRKSTRNSSEMWIPLSDTPEPVERSQTRILVRSTDGVQVPTIESSESDNDTETYNDTSSTKAQDTKTSLRGEKERSAVSMKPPLPVNGAISKGSAMGKPVRQSTQSKLPWMDKSLEPVSAVTPPTKQTSSAAPHWLDNSKSNPLRSSLDDMLEALDKWEPADVGKEKLKTIFDETAGHDITPQPSQGVPDKVATEMEDSVYIRAASREMMAKSNSSVTTTSRRKKWQQPSADLEASWTSLDIFAKSHKGRLSMEEDTLDEYLRTVSTPGTGITVDSSSQKSAVTKVPTAPLQTISEEAPFIIPELPHGQNMVINIKSTWGDKYYVGLNGIELFADNGEPISISEIQADPRDINVLPDYKNDPRVVTNLTDGINKTRDDIHMWLAPFTDGGNHFICVTFSQPCHVALLRVWNYNKSRIHSYRGAKDVEISLDGTYIFKGEIARACGGTQGGTEAFGDTILFTMSDEILDAVSRHDGQYEGGNFSDEWEDDVPYDARPATADKGDSIDSPNQDRPRTSVEMKNERKPSVHHSIVTPAKTSVVNSDVSAPVPVAVDGSTLVYQTSTLQLVFTETWGDPHYLGLTGFEVVGKDGEALPLTMNMLHAEPRDLHILPGYETDDRTFDKVIDGVNITVSDEHMWLIPYTAGANHTVTISFSKPEEIVGLRFWNYNKSTEDTYRGAKTVHVMLDNSPISPPQGFLIRKGPGNCFYDFAQELLFSDILRHIQLDSQLPELNNNETSADDSEDYVISGNMPNGFVYQFHLLSTQSDLYYVGLNAIEFFNSEGKKIELDENNIAAYPESVNVLDGIEGDVRTPDKLVNGMNDTNNGDHMWLAPILPAITNRLFVIFDYPQTVSMIKIWNYSKTPSRGVKDFALLVDDLLVYNGMLGPVRYGKGILPNSLGPQSFQTILFTNNRKIKDKVKHTIVSNKTENLEVQLTNDNQVVSKPSQSKLQKSADQALRPKTSVQKRPLGKRR